MTNSLPGLDSISSARNAYAITKHDTNLQPARALWVGGVGDVAVQMQDGPDAGVIFSAVPAGTYLPVAVRRVLSTGTTASLIVGLI